MSMRPFGSVHVSLPSIAVAVLGFAVAWPIGAAAVFYMLFGERLGLRPRVRDFCTGLGRGLTQGSCNCGPSVFFDGRGSCALAPRRQDEPDRTRRPDRRPDR
jgi:hypothetical protein